MRKSLIFADGAFLIAETNDRKGLWFRIGKEELVLPADDVEDMVLALGGHYSEKELEFFTKEDLEARERIKRRLADEDNEPEEITPDDCPGT